MHFDHKNIFEKNGSICSMVWSGEAIEKIQEEFKKCQLMCEDCHSMVTNLERKYGLLTLKKFSEEEMYPEYKEKTQDNQERILQRVKDIKRKNEKEVQGHT